jgi:S-adenosylmethionine:tRNA-ribosyltransferase-isomerase (queuine synthetase)
MVQERANYDTKVFQQLPHSEDATSGCNLWHSAACLQGGKAVLCCVSDDDTNQQTAVWFQDRREYHSMAVIVQALQSGNVVGFDAEVEKQMTSLLRKVGSMCYPTKPSVAHSSTGCGTCMYKHMYTHQVTTASASSTGCNSSTSLLYRRQKWQLMVS